MSDAGWAPLVYARTPARDDWWRAVPGLRSGGPPPEWRSAVVHAAVQGGRDLRHGPRFLLACAGGTRLVGVACRAVELSASMHTDGARELYGFVGWFGRARPPELADLRAHYRQWAGAEYERRLRPVWDLGPTQATPAEPTGPAPGPWGELAAADADPLEVGRSGAVEVWPEDDAEQLWRAAAASTEPVVVVTGLRVARPGRLVGLTHVASIHVEERQVVVTDRGAEHGVDEGNDEGNNDAARTASGPPERRRPVLSQVGTWLRRATGR
ncbi:hypothetical protein [Pseudonocardia sp.]|uniref:hypothetical protein n=1 Tax=Pseudonocardia sp. TaxID=60912 RepID=UPI003D0D4219